MSATPHDLIKFIDSSPSPYHCVQAVVQRLVGAGFSELSSELVWPKMGVGEGHFIRRNGTLIAWRNGSGDPAGAGFRVVGAHTDSPNLRLKPTPEYQSHGLTQWGVQVYGGVLLYTWFDRDLGLSGRVFTQGDDGLVEHLVNISRPIARIPSLAIHFNRSVSETGFKPNKQDHLPPLVALDWDLEQSAVDHLISESIELDSDQIVGHDLMLHPLAPSVLGGVREEFIFAPRLDNQASCYTALEGLLDAKVGEPTALISLFDHEECGSGSAHGGDGALIEHVMRRIVTRHEVQSDGGFERAAANSYMISSDMAHGVHPNYSAYHDGAHKPLLGGGPVIKTHTNQRYATDGETAARFRTACAALDIPVQEFAIRTDLRCGSTIGPIPSSNLAIRTVDVGCSMLSMHSIREQAASADVAMMAAVKAHVLGGSN